jgi:hypothetical protein
MKWYIIVPVPYKGLRHGCIGTQRAQTQLLFFYIVFSSRNNASAWNQVSAPKFAGSNPTKTVEFLGQKNPQHAFLRRGNKTVCPMSQLCGM